MRPRAEELPRTGLLHKGSKVSAASPPPPLLLTAYGLPYTMGYIADAQGVPNPTPRDLVWLAGYARQLGLAGIEAPLGPVVSSFQGTTVRQRSRTDELVEECRRHGLSLVSDYGAVLDRPQTDFEECLRRSHQCGAEVVRVVLSHALCGDRRNVGMPWKEHLRACAVRLRETVPLARDLGLRIAVENHQDATSADLLWLVEEVGDPGTLGVCLDTGNPLAVAEGPVPAAARLAPLIHHLHLKDYRVHRYSCGYRLTRCANGAGVVDFEAVLRAVLSNGNTPTLGVEIAAQQARSIPILEDAWWRQHEEDQVNHLPEALGAVWSRLLPEEEPWESAWERGVTGEDLVSEELSMVQAGVSAMRQLLLRVGSAS